MKSYSSMSPCGIGLFSLSIIPLRFEQVVACPGGFFLLIRAGFHDMGVSESDEPFAHGKIFEWFSEFYYYE